MELWAGRIGPDHRHVRGRRSRIQARPFLRRFIVPNLPRVHRHESPYKMTNSKIPMEARSTNREVLEANNNEMAGERMAIQIGVSRKRRGRRTNGTCSILNVDFNGGGGLLRLGAAGALLAAAFAAHRFLVRKRKSGSMPEPLDRVYREGIQENSGKRLAHEAVDGENEGERGVQICASDSPAVIMAVEETGLEDHVSYDHNVAIIHEIQRQDEKTEENLTKESQEGMEGNRRETKEYSSAESREIIEFSTEQDNRDSLSNVFEARKCLEPEGDGRADRLSVKNVALEIHPEPQTQIKEEEDVQIAKLSFDGASVIGAKRADEATKHETGTGLIQEKNVSGERRRQRAATGHGFLVMTLAIVFAVWASFLCHEGFDDGSHDRLGRLYCRFCQLFYSSFNNTSEEV